MNKYAEAGLSEIERIRAEYARRESEIPADYYGWNRVWNQFRYFQVERACLSELVRERMFPMVKRRVLDVGCGRGTWLLQFAKWGVKPQHLCGVDLDQGRVDLAASLLPAASFFCGDARRLPWDDASMDIAAQFTVFTSILDIDLKRTIAREMLRVLRKDGLLLWYDFHTNNPVNRQVRGVGKKEIRSLFPNCSLRFRKLTLAPPLARVLVPFSWPLALIVESVLLFNTHYLVVIRKR
jgi:ubiquinone/menaquinone biosynthesis C-methylase UbiE